jgi:four helix bundle protein
MTSYPGGDFRNIVEWEMVEDVSNTLKETIEDMHLTGDREWLAEVIKEAADGLPTSIIEGQQSQYVAEYILGISAARNSLVIASYTMNFLKSQGLIDATKAEDIEQKLDDLEKALASLTQNLRKNLPNQWRFSNN